MKKQITFLIIIIAMCGFSARSQTLYNTKWYVYDASGTFMGYFRFSTDTLSYSFDNVSYTNESTFQVNGNIFTIHDLLGTVCTITDTGRYTFLIRNDSLKFTLKNDLCISRSNALTTQYYVAFHLGIHPMNQLTTNISVYPDPANDLITIKISGEKAGNNLTIMNIEGRKLIDRQITGSSTQIDISTLPSGVYFVRVTNHRTMQVGKFIKN
jgi:hypothetical protein